MEATGSAELREVYEEQYSADGDDAARYGRWRALCAQGKAEHVVRLAGALATRPRGRRGRLRRRRAAGADGEPGLGDEHRGYEISERAVAIAGERLGPGVVERFDGEHLPVADGAYDLGVLSHVLEHVPDPLPLLRETARACRAVVVEVPLEDNRSASRPEAERGRQAIGHLHRFNRGDMHVMCAAAGLRVEAELSDPLPLKVHTFFAETAGARAKAVAKAAARRAVYLASAKAAERSFTVHYACLAFLSDSQGRAADHRAGAAGPVRLPAGRGDGRRRAWARCSWCPSPAAGSSALWWTWPSTATCRPTSWPSRCRRSRPTCRRSW